MIKCPKCKKVDTLILEQPSWFLTDNPLDEYIEVQSHCCSCNIDFTTLHILGRVIKVKDILSDVEYPASC